MQGRTWCPSLTYNNFCGWSAAILKYIKISSITAHFPLLHNALGPRTSPPYIIDLMEDTDPVLHIARVTDSPPLTAEG